jgi:hypothetical protein
MISPNMRTISNGNLLSANIKTVVLAEAWVALSPLPVGEFRKTMTSMMLRTESGCPIKLLCIEILVFYII